MKKIHIAIDYSEASANAVRFAKAWAEDWKLELEVIHVWFPQVDVERPEVLIPDARIEQLQRGQLADFLTKNGVDKERGRLEVGLPTDRLVALSKEENWELLLVGNSGKHGVMDQIFGSVSTHLVRYAACPVLSLPADYEYSGSFRKILYATDYTATDERSVDQLITFAEKWKSTVHFVHVNTGKGNNKTQLIEDTLFAKIFEREAPSFAFEMASIREEDVVKGLSDYINANQIDLIVMVTPYRDWWDRLWHKSLTKAMNLSALKPLMVFHLT